ncbi:MAG: L-rhamnose isomerase [Planctomycetota bacterium]|jgi:hypothetical protein
MADPTKIEAAYAPPQARYAGLGVSCGEAEGDVTSRLTMLEELKRLPFGAVWDYH